MTSSHCSMDTRGSDRMTADERLNKVLARFGQTIYDLPKEYKNEDREWAIMTTFSEFAAPGKYFIDQYADMICHMADVIDRMEAALENATAYICSIKNQEHAYYYPNCDADDMENLRLDDDFLADS